MNVELLQKIQERILRNPELFYMNAFFRERGCGTAACIAGWAVCLGENIAPKIAALEGCVGIRARCLLELSGFEHDRLFFLQGWPDRFSRAYLKLLANRDHLGAAKVAWRRIDHFIATEGRE